MCSDELETHLRRMIQFNPTTFFERFQKSLPKSEFSPCYAAYLQIHFGPCPNYPVLLLTAQKYASEKRLPLLGDVIVKEWARLGSMSTYSTERYLRSHLGVSLDTIADIIRHGF
jgi:hypothetical protein